MNVFFGMSRSELLRSTTARSFLRLQLKAPTQRPAWPSISDPSRMPANVTIVSYI